MKISFREYVGEVGSLQALLIAEREDGRKESILFNTAFFYEFNRWVAQKRLLWRMKHLL